MYFTHDPMYPGNSTFCRVLISAKKTSLLSHKYDNCTLAIHVYYRTYVQLCTFDYVSTHLYVNVCMHVFVLFKYTLIFIIILYKFIAQSKERHVTA